MIDRVMGVYFIRNTVTGLMYIGSSVNVRKRIVRHFQSLNKGTHHSQHLQRAWDKYGETAFDYGVAELVENRDLLQEREQEWIDCFGTYNVAKFADRPQPPIMTDERRQRMSEIMKGRIGTMKGKKHSNETRALMSQQRNGVKRPQIGAAISKGKQGSHLRDSTKEKLSVAAQDRWSDPARREKFLGNFAALKEQGRGPWVFHPDRKPRERIIKHDSHVRSRDKHVKKMAESLKYRKSVFLKEQEGVPLHDAHVAHWGKWRKATAGSETMKRNWANPEFRKAARLRRSGAKVTDAQKAAISVANTGRSWTQERRERYNQTVCRPEVKAKLAKGRRGVPWTPEMREKILASRAKTNARKKAAVGQCQV